MCEVSAVCEVSSGIGSAGGNVTYLHADLHVFVALCFKQNLSPGRLTAYSIGSASHTTLKVVSPAQITSKYHRSGNFIL